MSRPLIFGVCALGLSAVLCARAAAEEPKKEDLNPIRLINLAEAGPRAKVEAILAGPAKLDFDRLSIDKIVEYLRREYKLEIRVDSAALKSEGVQPDIQISFRSPPIHSTRVPGPSLRRELQRMLWAVELGFWIDRGEVVITTANQVLAQTEIVIYPVDDLLDANVESAGIKPAADLIDTIGTAVWPTTWDYVGGPGSVTPLAEGKSLLVVQSAEAQDEIGWLLAALRTAGENQRLDKPKLDPIDVLPRDEIEARAEILSALERRGDFDFQDRPLPAVVEDLEARFKIEIHIDRKQLEDAQIDADELRITERLKGVSLATALTTMLKPLDLKYAMIRGVLTIMANEKDESIWTKVYPVGDLVLKPGQKRSSFQSLIEAVEEIAPTSWDETGGMGTVHEFRHSLALVITQRGEVHDEIAQLLSALRQKAAGK